MIKSLFLHHYASFTGYSTRSARFSFLWSRVFKLPWLFSARRLFASRSSDASGYAASSLLRATTTNGPSRIRHSRSRVPCDIQARYGQVSSWAYESVFNILTSVTGTCEIAVEIVDPFASDRPGLAWVEVAPDVFRGMAGWVIRQCVQNIPPIGGFVTKNISSAINYLQSPTASLVYGEWRASSPSVRIWVRLAELTECSFTCSVERYIFYCGSTSRDPKCWSGFPWHIWSYSWRRHLHCTLRDTHEHTLW